MDKDLHLKIGTRVINKTNGKLGCVVEPHYLCRPEYRQICVQYDEGPTGYNENRSDIEHEGSRWYADILKRWGHSTTPPTT